MAVSAVTSRLCHHVESWCTRPATHMCVDCAQRFCGEHILRATFTGPGLSVPAVLTICPECLDLAIQQERILGRTLSQWRKMG